MEKKREYIGRDLSMAIGKQLNAINSPGFNEFAKRNIRNSDMLAAHYTYDNIYTLCKAGYLDVKAAFHDIGTELKPPAVIPCGFIDRCDNLDDDNLEYYRKAVHAALPDFFSIMSFDKMSPTMKIRMLYRRKYSYNWIKEQTDPDIKILFKMLSQARELNVPACDLQMITDNVKISMHWLLGFDESIPLFAKKGATDQIIDYLCLISENARKSFISEIMET